MGADVRHDGALSGAATAHGPSGFTRLVSTLQIAGTLLGVPLALGSGYSIYRANFSADTNCQSLRGNIIAMLDKNVDAATRRILVRRDVTAFEQSCGGIDPDATAAFKTLLAADKAAVAVAPKPRAERPPAEIAHKAEPRPAVAAKQPVTAAKSPAPPAAAIEPAPLEREAAVSDTKWLAAVRQALVSHDPEQAEPVKAAPATPAAPRPETLAPGKLPAPILQPAWTVPALPPVASPSAVSAPADRAPQQTAEHPVPPESIPGPTPLSLEPKTVGEERSGGSRLGAWIAEIPLLSRVIDRGRD